MRPYACGLSSFALLFLHFLGTVFSQQAPTINYFTNPVPGGYTNYFLDDPVWTIGDSQTISWITNYTSYEIWIWQQDITIHSANEIAVVYSVGSDGSGEHSFNWTVSTYSTSLAHSPVYYFWFVSSDESEPAFPSHYFNLTEASTSASTSTPTSTSISISTSSSTATLETTTASSTLSSASTTSEPTTTVQQTSTSTDNSQQTTTIALGVGLGIGIPLLLILGVWFGYTLFAGGKAKNNAVHSNSYPPEGPYHEGVRTDYGNHMGCKNSEQNGGPWTKAEMDGNVKTFSELPPRSTSPVELSGN